MNARPADKTPTLADLLAVITDIKRDLAATRSGPVRPIVNPVRAGRRLTAH